MAVADFPQAAQKLSLWLVDKAIVGLPPLASASELARVYREDSRHPHDEARIEAMVRWEIGKNFTAGFISGLAGVLTLPIALPSAMGATWLLQARMSAALAALRGHSLDEPWVQSLVLLSLMGSAAPEVLRKAGVRASEWAARKAVARLSEEALLQINRRVGFRLLSTATSRGVINVSRLVPVVGAAVGGAIDAYGCRAVAKSAARLFEPRLLLPAHPVER